MAYFRCTTGGSGKGNTLVVTCADDLAGATITCTNGTKTYTKTCPSTAPYEVTFYGLEAGTYTVSATVSGNTYTTTVVITDYEAALGGFNWKTWVDLSENYTSSDFTDLDDLLSDETAIRELMTIHDCVDYLAGITTTNADVETIIGNDLCAKWINNRDYALDTLYANEIIAGYMDTADKYGYGEWCLMPQVPKMTSNTAPYGTAFASTAESSYPAYMAFDDDNSSYWSSTGATNQYVGYSFVSPIKLGKVKIIALYSSVARLKNFKIQGSNDGFVNDVNDLYTGVYPNTQDYELNVVINADEAYTDFRLYATDTHGSANYIVIKTLQFYAYAPKGNVPIMTANTAPYGEAICSTNSSGNDAYRAFDKNAATMWSNSGSSVAGSYVGYKFTNPIYTKRFKLTPSSTSSTARTWTVKIQASNDNSDWKDLTDNFVWDSHNEYEGTPTKNKGYYLYHRLYYVSGTSDNWANIGELQFYGRSLSVSVPTMTSNTAPFGVASADSSGTNTPAWKAFNDSESVGWVCGSASFNNYILKYTFTNPIMPKKCKVKFVDGSSRAITHTIQLLGSNDGGLTWDVISEEVVTGTINQYKEIDLTATQYYMTLGMKDINSPSGYNANAGDGFKLQFYGLDYSEKEFETGTTKKWLYDHGVELETATTTTSGSDAIARKETDNLYIEVPASGSRSAKISFTSQDLTNYDLARFVADKIVYCSTTSAAAGTISLFSGNTEVAYKNVIMGDSNLPNNLSLDVSAINQTYDVVFNAVNGNSGITRKCSMSELWLE